MADEVVTSHKFWEFNYHYADYNLNKVPFIVPIGQTPDVGIDILRSRLSNKKIQNIDVLNDFMWTRTPKKKRKNIPQITLVEKRIKTSSVITNAQLVIQAGLNDAADTIDMVGNKFVNVASLGNVAPDQVEMAQRVTKVINELGDKLKTDDRYTDVIRSYNGYYITERTGFIYNFPLKQTNIDTKTSFEENRNSEHNPLTLTGWLGFATEQAEKAYKVLNENTHFNERKTHFEKQLDFEPTKEGKSIDIEFMLDNTFSWEETVKNWHFIFMFTFQNTPGRRSISLLDPPCIYEIHADGIMFAPYAYITNISVEHIGNWRQMDVPFGQKLSINGSVEETVRVNIPEAYKIKMTVSAMHVNTRNFAIESLNKGRIVSTQQEDTI